jgi:hypothetical protein
MIIFNDPQNPETEIFSGLLMEPQQIKLPAAGAGASRLHQPDLAEGLFQGRDQARGAGSLEDLDQEMAPGSQ